MKIEASSPTRIDLAGGTLDVYPLYLFEEGGLTVNLGITLKSYVRLETREDDEIHLFAEDMEEELSAPSVDELPLEGPMKLVARVVKFYTPRCGINVYTRNEAPKGSGLGASSSLLISLTAALDALNETGMSREQMIDIGANLEAQVIGIPTGKQDYYAACYGGVNAIWFEVDHNRVEPLLPSEEALEELESRLILSFTGISHFSGASNWAMLKSYIENKGETVQALRRIKETAYKMREALMHSDFDSFAEQLAIEWENRRNLAEGVSNERIDSLMAKAAEAGALASKICGAGGGGCMITFAEAGREEEVKQALQAAGAELLEYKIAREGTTLTINGKRP